MSEKKENVGELKQSYFKESIQLEWKIDHFKFEPFKFLRYTSCHFIFAGSTWMLKLENLREVVYISISNCGDNELKNITYKIGLKKINDDIEYFPPETILDLIKRKCPYMFRLCNKQSEELQEKFAPQNILTIICTMRLNFPNSAPKSKSATPLILDGLNTLSENFKQILTNKDNCDVTLRVKEKEFHAHKIILMARSPVFACMFRHDSSENQTGIVTIPDCDPDSFHNFLEYLYCGKLEEVSFCSILHLYSTADKYNVQELKCFCVDYMTHCLTTDNVCEVLILADMYDDEELFSAAKDFFHENTSEVVVSSQWKELLQSENNFHLVNKLMIDMSKKRKISHCSS